MRMKLLIVEDDFGLRRALKKGLIKLGYDVDVAVDGEEALDKFFEDKYQLIVLDLNLPKRDGFNVLSVIRAECKTIPVLILSARADVEDKITGLDFGANDYITKPFHFKELDARIRALLRRNFTSNTRLIHLTIGVLDTKLKHYKVNEAVVNLTNTEYQILEFIAIRSGQVVPVHQIISAVWGDDLTDDYVDTFKVHLSGLRKKLTIGLIKNARGRGYYVE